MPSDEPHTPSPDGLDILAEMAAWRATHPTATLAEIEAVLDDRLATLRRQILTDTVAKSPQAEWSSRPPDARKLGAGAGLLISEAAGRGAVHITETRQLVSPCYDLR